MAVVADPMINAQAKSKLVRTIEQKATPFFGLQATEEDEADTKETSLEDYYKQVIEKHKRG